MNKIRTIAPVLVSTTLAAGRGEDKTTPHFTHLAAQMGFTCLEPRIIADGNGVGDVLTDLLTPGGPDVVLTSGGTGVTPDDLTPELTAPLLDKHLPGVMEALRAHGMTKTPLAALSRGVAGVSGSAVVINLPGSPNAVGQAAEVLVDILPHLCDQAADIRPVEPWGEGHHG